MKTVAGRIVIAVLLFGAAAASLAQARQARRLADAHRHLATLQHDPGNGETGEAFAALPWPLQLRDDSGEQRATTAYWRSEYDLLTDATALAEMAGPQGATDPAVLFTAANAAFRAAESRPGDRTVTVERLDRVVQTYADVLRADPAHTDAAFNFEYVARYRDTLARGKGIRGAKPGAPVEIIPSHDLPVGPTLHGRPGGPPPEIPGSDFKTLAPMPFEEREETDPGQGPAPRRRG
jgi:hypothetical protein